MQKNQEKRLGYNRGASEIKIHPFFSDVNWEKLLRKEITPPEPYLAAYAKSIIEQSPYQAAGNPSTKGKICALSDPNYYQGWSFIDTNVAASFMMQK